MYQTQDLKELTLVIRLRKQTVFCGFKFFQHFTLFKMFCFPYCNKNWKRNITSNYKTNVLWNPVLPTGPVRKINLPVNIVYPLTVPSCALLLRSGPSLRLSSTSTSAPSSNAGSSSYSSRGVGQQDAIRNICRTTRNSASFRSRLSNSDMARPARHVG